jgi:hypothetical protein
MSLDFRHRRNRFTGSPTMRHGSALILCGLLLLLCVNARLARYDIQQRTTTRLATTQSYLDGGETIRKLAAGAVFLLLCAGMFAGTFKVFTPTSARAVSLAAVVPSVTAFRGVDPESYLRPPPTR